MDCPQIRQEFLRYYQAQGFQSVPPAPMLSPSKPMSYIFSCNPPDPTDTPNPSENKFVRIQPCSRHFDMNTVGTDNQHLSLFEMYGTFHFGNDLYESTIRNVWHRTAIITIGYRRQKEQRKNRFGNAVTYYW